MGAHTGKGNTPLRAIRIPDAVWDAAKRKAAKQGTTVSEVIRTALRSFVGEEG